jgi:hypothetical protein
MGMVLCHGPVPVSDSYGSQFFILAAREIWPPLRSALSSSSLLMAPPIPVLAMAKRLPQGGSGDAAWHSGTRPLIEANIDQMGQASEEIGHKWEGPLRMPHMPGSSLAITCTPQHICS